MELISNNVVEPWLYSSRLGLSELGVIMAAVAWFFLWGPVGLVLATPLTVCLVVLGEYIPALSLFPRLLGDMPVLDLHCRFYQRLLAQDEAEAKDLARKVVDEEGLDSAIDGLFVPAMALAERDRENGLLKPEDESRLNDSLVRLFENARELTEAKLKQEAGDPEEPASVPPTFITRAPVIVWPSVPLAACAVSILQWQLRHSGAEMTVLSPQTLSAEAGVLAQQLRPAAFCLISLGGTSPKRERQLIKRVRSASDVVIIAARLGDTGTLADDARESLLTQGATLVTRTLSETSTSIRTFLQQAAMAKRDK